MPTIGVFVMFSTNTLMVYQPPEIKRAVYLIVFLSTFVLPFSFIPFFLYNKLISGIMMKNRKERIIPLIVTSVMYIFAAFLIYRIPVAVFLKKFIVATAINVILVLIVSLRWKISVHMVGVGGLVGLVYALSFYDNSNILNYLIAAIVMAGLVGTSRLQLKAHEPPQVYAGFLQGLIIVSIFLLFF
jgi:hypothetical protein